MNPLAPFLTAQGVLILDGGLATALEARGHDLRDRLWSARLLADDPAAIREIHDAYLRAGADCVTTASYQATLEGFRARGLTRGRAALARLIAETRRPAWMAFSCRDGHHLCDGSPFADVIAHLARGPGLVAIGVNCTAPAHVESLLEDARRVTDLPLVAYPNSGETYDARSSRWSGAAASAPSGDAPRWRALGARLIGGCCRVGPDDIRRLRADLLGPAR